MIEGTSVADQMQLKQSQRYEGKGSTELWKDLSANWWNYIHVVEEHKNKTDIPEAIIYFLLRNLPKRFAMGNLTDHKGRDTKAWPEEFE